MYEVPKSTVAQNGHGETSPAASPAAGDPHAGVPGAPPLGDAAKAGGDPHAGVPGAPPLGGSKTGDPHAGLSGGGGMPGGGMPGSGAPRVTDAPPPHWKKQPLTAMRQANYQVEGENGAALEATLIILRRSSGSALPNVNLWRAQLGLPELDQAGLEAVAQPIALDEGEATLFDIAGLPEGADPAKDGRIIGVIAKMGNDAWFYKLRGNAELAGKEKSAFLRWVSSVKAAKAAAPATADGGAAAAPAPAEAGSAPAAPAKPKKLTWQLPAAWAESASSSMRYATVTVTGADGTKAELAVTSFPGDVGGDLENVNRWRAQVGAEPVKAEDLPGLVRKIAAGDKEFLLIDVTGPSNRTIAGWVRHGPDTWFFKLTGPEALLGAEKEKFTAFLSSVRFTEGQ